MEIRKSTPEDINEIMDCINTARQLMRESGNTVQWTNGYPSKELMLESVEKDYNFLIINDDEVVATFDFIIGDDPNYSLIENGAWLNDEKYGVVHRLASNGKAKGVAQFCFEWCFQLFPNIRIDTHETNVAMQKVLERLGYQKCGIIYVADGTPRLAYQKIDNK
ncbi:GNAT family N-acetyltransferase [Epilithonimonas hungarica]|uniref:Acetyltransferase (GNAT) domain-containing protein n=1 Tax=Epilithonimonas hungarica TaxID=454006 RepID=A0A1G7VBY0_9FLAO|nr:GNAT family N-acetyltransferase [Epilithonimonas hungarica]SDG57316.1 Acetyltransferase (GNAT) domain-containing protein [Epilithonimonas hungarica]